MELFSNENFPLKFIESKTKNKETEIKKKTKRKSCTYKLLSSISSFILNMQIAKFFSFFLE